MPKVRDVLGHVSVEVANRKRKCHRKPNKHSISNGETCLVVFGGAYNSRKNYCKSCASEILSQADARIIEIRNKLGSNALG
jgi:hypothetical protein